MIAVRDLHKRIGPQEILRGVDMSVGAGETLVIIGRSGGGKSVLLKNLIGLMQPDAGEKWIDGQNIIRHGESQLAAVRRKGGSLLQARARFDSRTIEEKRTVHLQEEGARTHRQAEEEEGGRLEVE